MEAQAYLQKKLREKMDEIKSKNSQFSLRAFSRLLSLSPSSLSEFLNGKRNFSEKKMRSLADHLCFDPSDWEAFNQKISDDYKTPEEIKKTSHQVQIANDQYFLVADWHYYSILSLIETSEFIYDLKWIAKRLNTTVYKVESCIERLSRIGFIRINDDNSVSLKEVELVTSEDIPNTSLKKRHEKNLEAAKESLYQDSVGKRDFSFGTIAINPDQLPEAKKMIRDFQDELFAFLQEGEKSEVYEICMHMFPRTKINNNKDQENINEKSN